MPVETNASRMIFRKTNAGLGRHVAVTPGNSANRHLSYSRIILNGQLTRVQFHNGDQETGFIVLSGAAKVSADGRNFELTQYDGIYIPRDSSIEVSTTSDVDIAEFSCDVSNRYPLQVVRYAEIAKDPSLKFTAGVPTQQRHLNIVLGKNVEAGRLVAGFTVSEPGNWSSWPPHEHSAMLEEMYVYFNMPDPGFAIQMVYENTKYPETVTVVRDGDAVPCRPATTRTSRCPAIVCLFCGPWRRTAKSSTGNSAWSMCSRASAPAVPDWKPAANKCRQYPTVSVCKARTPW